MSNHHDSFLDTLPGGWTFDRLKDVVALRNEKTDEASADEDYLELEDLESGTGRILNRRNTLEVESAVTLFKKGDVLFGKLRPYLEKYYQADFDGKCTGEILAFKPERVASRFLFYCFGSRWFIERCNALAYGAKMPRVSWEKQLSQFNLPLPPLPEQQRIAAYLDASCAAIDAAVAAKRRQLETLDALRAVTIHRAVTRGLYPAIKLKPSGVEWFDTIPEHWEVDRLKDLVASNRDAIKVGPFGSDLLLGDMADEGVKVYNQRTVIDRDFESGIHFISEEKYAAMKAFTVYPSDLLVTTRGTIGRCAIVPKTASLGIPHPCLMRVQTNKRRLLPEYLAVLIQDCGLVLRQLEMMSAATTIDVIYSGSLKRTCLPVPPVAEQCDILKFIADKLESLQRLVTGIETQVATLTAYRKSLIHECVTGQRRITEADLAGAKRAGAGLSPKHQN